MSLTEHKKILLIGGVVAGSAIILAARILIGDGFTTNETTGINLKETFRSAQTQTLENYERFKASATDDEEVAALKAKVEAQAAAQASDEATIKTLGEKLKTTSKTDTTNK